MTIGAKTAVKGAGLAPAPGRAHFVPSGDDEDDDVLDNPGRAFRDEPTARANDDGRSSRSSGPS